MRRDTPLVTVYVTSHNYGRFIERALNSVLGQTMTDYELIIIDDGSTDNSREVIQSFIGHPRIIPVFQENKGLNVTNNIALRAARGKYIMRLDADDWLDENALAVLSGALEREPEVGLVFPDYYLVNEAGHVLEMVRRHDFDDVTLMDQPAHGACTMIRRQCLLDLGGYDESFRCQDGFDLWMRFIEQFTVKNVNLPLFYYRQHGSSLTRNEKRILDTRNRILERQARSRGQHLNVLAVVPVRGPSFDPGSLALETLGGKALIDWTLDHALAAGRVSAVVMSTPDQRVLDHVTERYAGRVLCHRREPKLAMPNTHIEATLAEAADWHVAQTGQAIDTVAHLAVESPFRTGHHIDSAVNMLELFDTDAVISVRPETDQFHTHDGTGLHPLRQTSTLRLERDELYRATGGLKVMRLSYLRDRPADRRLGHVVLDQVAAHTIRSDIDWMVAGVLAQKATS